MRMQSIPVTPLMEVGMSLLRDSITGLWKSIRGFSGAMQVALLTDGFWMKRQFRAYYEFSVPDSTTKWVRLTAPRPFILQSQSLYVETNALRVVVYTGVVFTDAVWAPLDRVYGKHLIDGPSLHVSTADELVSGTGAGGAEREVLRASAGTGPGNTGTPMGIGLFGWRALPAGTYYFALTASIGTCTGVYSFEAEELIYP
jgi:hypothetical protein